jgi:hypothetical protein
MALINCPECVKEISNKAASCPFCGFPVEDNVFQDEVEQLETLCQNYEQDSFKNDKQPHIKQSV